MSSAFDINMLLRPEIDEAIEEIKLLDLNVVLAQGENFVIVEVLVEGTDKESSTFVQKMVTGIKLLISAFIGIIIGIEIATANPELAKLVKALISLLVWDTF